MKGQEVNPKSLNHQLRLLKEIGRRVQGGFEIRLSREKLAQLTGATLFTCVGYFLIGTNEARRDERPCLFTTFKLLRSSVKPSEQLRCGIPTVQSL